VVSLSLLSIYRGENAPGTQWTEEWVIPTGSLDAAKEKYLALWGKFRWFSHNTT